MFRSGKPASKWWIKHCDALARGLTWCGGTISDCPGAGSTLTECLKTKETVKCHRLLSLGSDEPTEMAFSSPVGEVN